MDAGRRAPLLTGVQDGWSERKGRVGGQKEC